MQRDLIYEISVNVSYSFTLNTVWHCNPPSLKSVSQEEIVISLLEVSLNRSERILTENEKGK